MASSPELPKVGATVGERFQLEGVLGEGGMGVVYEALDRRTKRPCAIKVLFPHHCDKPQVIARFDREARVTARLKGPNVARVFDVGVLPSGLRYIAMERLVGTDLGAELERRGRLPISLSVDIVVQVAHAMSEAHSIGVIHRDLKPENIFLVASDGASPDRPLVKVLDFGISRLVEGDEKLTTDYAPLGTAFYMSPEQIEHASRVDKRTDVWSLGVVLYEMLVGRVPFEGEGTGVLVSIATRPAPRPSELGADIPPDLEIVVMRALEKSPDARFQSMDAFARALAPWAPAHRVRPRRRRAAAVLVVGMAAAAATATALALDLPLTAKRDEEPKPAPSASASASAHGSKSAPPHASTSSPSGRHATIASGTPPRSVTPPHGSAPRTGAQPSAAPRTTPRR